MHTLSRLPFKDAFRYQYVHRRPLVGIKRVSRG